MNIIKCAHKVCTILMETSRPIYIWVLLLGIFIFPINIGAQELVLPKDSIITINLDEVILISARKTLDYHRQPKPLSTLDEYLESSKKVDMVKRGAYAWEPTLNNMFSERLSVTIDGMRIFGACTDKMDPVTSYVDVSNLSRAHIASGQQGTEHGNTIGGAINLELDRGNFKETGLYGGVETGFESNNQMSVVGAEFNYSDSNFYVDTDIIYRKAENYVAGGDEEVEFSQFEKYNVSANGGYKLAEDRAFTASLIYDEARDVGYPALTMDVSLARAIIASVGFEQDALWGSLTNWKSKMYFNKVTHVMDDTKRPDVPIHMDMPGWSDTYGFYSQAALKAKRHQFLFKLDGYYNKSLAEMTMYPNDPNELPMFMLTWPDVRTANGGVYAEDELDLNGSLLKLATRLTVQNQNVADEFGLNSLKIFYPEMEKSKTRFLKSISGQWHKMWMPWHFNAGLSYGDRAPSVTEGYGFYLFNSFDNHDYIGDPGLDNEKSMEANTKISWEKSKFKLSAEANFFHIADYIIGEIDPSLSVMTIGAEGVKIYRNLDYTNLFNTSLDMEYAILPELKWSGLISYHRGTDNNGGNLPFISPFSYRSGFQFDNRSFSAALRITGAGKQVNYNPDFGEDQTQAYTVCSLTFGKTFKFNNDSMYAKFGVENIFDEYYSTYTDWKNIPRMGRNFFLTLSYSIN
ncbi:TonB-copper family protein [Arenibacter echinorum]|uniref:Iron complex outermembrane receptor protein n=1 Tax=Arenibacter echinorum TaxID=440515 RepID=A0A327QZF8_9FLAO|nr:TonB-dependent receptor [Arenibacter echinorum]RAJ10016.1 iron complex outermembrane receptor protein [Arenibacter echinorum]